MMVLSSSLAYLRCTYHDAYFPVQEHIDAQPAKTRTIIQSHQPVSSTYNLILENLQPNSISTAMPIPSCVAPAGSLTSTAETLRWCERTVSLSLKQQTALAPCITGLQQSLKGMPVSDLSNTLNNGTFSLPLLKTDHALVLATLKVFIAKVHGTADEEQQNNRIA
ncbi:hypothetical protein KCU99_g10169, partial [Aureobasidium melanogenum]